jgi:hypothetical protein
VKSDITRQDIINAIQDLAKKKGRNWLTRLEFRDESAIPQHQFSNHFERWNDAIIEAGLRPLDRTGRPDQPKGMTKEHLIQSALRVSEELGRTTISEAEFTKITGITYRPIHRLFGNWEQFMAEVGLDLHPAHKKKIPEEDLFKEFYRVKDEIGHLPSFQELAIRAKYSRGTFENRFGSFSQFKVNAIQFGIKTGLVQPDIGQSEIEKHAGRPKDKSVSYEALKDRPILGERLDFRGLVHAPVNELGVVYLFGMLSEELGFVVESVQAGFPDCEAKRRLPNHHWQRVHIEFEFRSSNFLSHSHDLSKCDLIICWEHDWRNCPIEVISLKEIIAKEKRA